MLTILKSIKSFRYAFRGLSFLLKKEHHIRVHTFIAAITVILGFIIKISLIEWLIIILCTGMVLMAEAINSAIEKLVDMVSPRQDFRAGLIKDLTASGVLLAAIAAAIIGSIIFIPKIIS
ncbi:MAG: diacylglycerol kinase family protein [Bacteroidales bacterium]|nr:diacylglycerol kinase family protein [Bacteroidales bacterium]